MSPTVSERDRDLLEEAQVITDAILTERGTGMPVMEMEMERLANCSDPLDCIQHDVNSLMTDLLNLVNMSRQIGRTRLHATRIDTRVGLFKSPLTLADGYVADVDAGTNPLAGSHRLEEFNESGHFQPHSILDEDKRSCGNFGNVFL